MRNLRLIPRLDVKQGWLIKGVQMEGWRKVGDPAEYAKAYADAGADELFFLDVVASLYNRNNLHDIVERVASSVFVPLTVGGGIRSYDDASALLGCGADKVALNTAATDNPALITAISNAFGSQATVITIEAIHSGGDKWEAMTDNGRNHTGRDVVEWAREVEDRGAGEIMVVSINRDGTGKGYELDLLEKVSANATVPVVASGGLQTPQHLADLINQTSVSAASVAAALHWKKTDFTALRGVLGENGCYVRPLRG